MPKNSGRRPRNSAGCRDCTKHTAIPGQTRCPKYAGAHRQSRRAQRREQKGRGQRNGNDRPSRPTREEQGIIRAMTTINNQDDFLEALRNNPQWRDAVRAQILGEDLMQLPVKFDAFMEQQTASHRWIRV